MSGIELSRRLVLLAIMCVAKYGIIMFTCHLCRVFSVVMTML